MTRLATVAVSPARAGVYLVKAQQFLKSAKRALADGDEESAGLLAIHAAISACDSITVRDLGLRAAGPRHLDVLELIDRLETPRKAQLKKHLKDLVSKKNVVEYEDRLLPRGDAGQMVKIAERVVDEARA